MERVLVSIDRKQLLRFVRFLRRFSLKWVLALLAAAFIIASGLSLYMSFVFLPVGKTPRPKTRVSTESLKLDQKKVSKADQTIILERNIFNSEGKMGDAIDGPAKSGTRSDKLVKSDLPLKLTGVIFAGDPFNGLAMIENTQKKRTSSYMVGETIQDDAKLVEIYDDRVILERNTGREYVELEKFVMPTPKRKGQGGRPGAVGTALDRLASKPPPDAYQEEGFERKGMNIKLTDEFKRNILAPEMLTKVLQDAKAEPNMVGGELKGFRLTRIRENSVYEKAGFQNNDIVEEINGIPLRDAAGAIRLLNQLRSEKEIEVRLNRNGSTQNMTIQIQ
ncbi:MAG TPA: type II secretion system protein GspC [Oligoflexus sp.]|uniref:type II secretion system protein GspC n=1 Tax=Oligoflexus sp. TaxID=1971216 RepID=UPI002D7F55A2|nr:type II secretion system protein GspC [Oligoflexus sp.]HET9238581.1 type II secretion system protein GspC [Oligoflexus sp.]